MRKRDLPLVVATSALAWSAVALADTPNTCRRFIVGRANSTAYPHLRLPAHGVASGVSCATLRRIARGLNNGSYPIPPGVGAHAPHYGRAFSVLDRKRKWSCRLEQIGGSGPTYAVKCSSGSARVRWHVG